MQRDAAQNGNAILL